MPFSLVFYKWMLAEEESFTLEDLNAVDSNLYEQLKKLQNIVHTRDRLMLESQASASNKSANRKRSKSKDDCAMESSTTFDENDQRLWLDGCRIDDLSLVFILPGYANIELKKGGKECSVSIHNLDEYVQVSLNSAAVNRSDASLPFQLVVYWTLVEGVRRQFESFRDGFNSIFSIHHLQCFYPDEVSGETKLDLRRNCPFFSSKLHQVFCGSGSTDFWDLKMLLESTRCDHGYNLNSRAVKWLFDLLVNFDIDEQRAFLQFVTGSPRLPVGGQSGSFFSHLHHRCSPL